VGSVVAISRAVGRWSRRGWAAGRAAWLLADVKEVSRTLQAIGRNRNRILSYLPLWDGHHKRFRRSRARGGV